MYSTMKRIYATTHNVEYLNKAVKKNWITEEQKNQIIEEVDGTAGGDE